MKRIIMFGMPTLIENKTLEENGALCSSLGLKFIELNMNFPEYQVDRLEHTDHLIKTAEQAGIYYTIHLDENLNIADFNRLVSDAYLGQMHIWKQFAGRLRWQKSCCSCAISMETAASRLLLICI